MDRKFQIKGKDLKALDFGCGKGIHSVYFENLGWMPFGVDISELAIKTCKERLCEENFVVIEPAASIKDTFDTKFDIIFANQS